MKLIVHKPVNLIDQKKSYQALRIQYVTFEAGEYEAREESNPCPRGEDNWLLIGEGMVGAAIPYLKGLGKEICEVIE